MKKRRIVSTLLALLLFASLPVSALAAEWDIGKGDITVNAGSGGQTVTQGSQVDIPDSAPVITGSSTENTVTINADKDQTASVTLSGANIDVSNEGKAAVSTNGEGNVSIELDGENTLKSATNHAGLEKNNGGSLTIADENKNGKLTAKGGDYGAGIGGGCYAQGNVTITGGTVTASGGKGGAGIGNGARGTQSAIDPGTIRITGGFVTAIGGSSYTVGNGSYGAGAAIGSGSRSNTNGTEIDTSTFTNAVVLRKSAATNQVMTGQVYGEPTLTTDATVPEGATLTIPEGTSLTIASGTTLTNSGAIYVDATLTNNGTLTNDGDGKLYYLLTVAGGTATATEGMATYNDKTYATQGTTVTLTAEDKVGMACTSWDTGDGNVTVENNQFTMPAQVLTVTAGYDNAPTYTVTIPATVNIGDGASTATIKAESVNVAADYSLNVKLTGTGIDGTGTDFTLVLQDDATETLAYTVTKGTDEEKTPVKVDDTVLTVAGGKANSSGSSILTFNLAENAVVKYSGSYTGTVTFTVSVETADSTDGTD